MIKLNNKGFWLIIIGLNCIFLIPLFLFALGAFPDYSLNQKEDTHLIGTSYMTMNNEFFEIINEEITSRAETEGDQVILRDPALNSERQIEQISEMIDQGVDALVINPVDWKALESVLDRARKKGIYILNVDSDIYDSSLVDTTVKSNNYQAGQIVGDYFLKKHNSARLVLLTHNAAKSSQDRIQGFLDTVKKNPDIEVVQEIECQGQTENAMPLMNEFIQKGVPFDTVFCLNDLASLGVVAALEKNNLLDQVKVYGVDATPDSKALIYENMMEATAAQFPTRIGQKAADVLYELFQGKEVSPEIKIPVELVTKDNANSYGIERWQ